MFELCEAATGEFDEEMLFVSEAALAERVDHAAQEHGIERFFDRVVNVGDEASNHFVDRVCFGEDERVRDCATRVGDECRSATRRVKNETGRLDAFKLLL